MIKSSSILPKYNTRHVKYNGHVLSDKGIAPDHSKIDAILNLKKTREQKWSTALSKYGNLPIQIYSPFLCFDRIFDNVIKGGNKLELRSAT